MAEKRTFEDLVYLLNAIETDIKETNMPERQKTKWIKFARRMAKAGFDLGKHGKAELS